MDPGKMGGRAGSPGQAAVHVWLAVVVVTTAKVVAKLVGGGPGQQAARLHHGEAIGRDGIRGLVANAAVL